MSSENWNAAYSAQSYVPQYTPRAQYRAIANSPQFTSTNETDTFESSGSRVGSGLLYTAGGAGAGAAAGYWLLGNPISETEEGLKVNEKFYKSIDNAMLERDISDALKAAELEKLKAQQINSKEEFEALKKLANAESLEKLPDEVKNGLPKNVTTPEAARELVQKAEAEIAKIDKSAIVKNTKEAFSKQVNYNEILQSSKNFEKLEAEIGKLADDIKPSELKEFITKNKNLFNIKGEDSVVAAEIERLSKLGKAELLKKVKEAGTCEKEVLKMLDDAILTTVSKETKSFIAEAPELIKNAAKEFKWSQAKQYGLWGAGIAFGAYLISSLFSSGNKQA